MTVPGATREFGWRALSGGAFFGDNARLKPTLRRRPLANTLDSASFHYPLLQL